MASAAGSENPAEARGPSCTRAACRGRRACRDRGTGAPAPARRGAAAKAGSKTGHGPTPNDITTRDAPHEPRVGHKCTLPNVGVPHIRIARH